MTSPEDTRVHRLSPTLANQIAAGEVIERPASVIKELLENSVDAGATRLDIDVEQGGISLIKVRDDGRGIHPDDLVLALSRHATSKVASLGDLESLQSLGFRGEALPSVASVARIELCSRPVEHTKAWQLIVEGSEVNAQPQPASHPSGTTVTVRDLFFNTPARRKFLRTEKTELKHLEDVIRRVALSRFDIEVHFRHNTRPVWVLPPATSDTASLRRLSKLCGAAFCEQALKIEFDAGDMRLTGWVGMPGYSRRQTDLQHFFLNGRMVRDRVVTHAIRQAYEADLAPGFQPAFVLYLQMDPTRVDVNVHPAKHEVRFRDSRSVHDFLFRTLQRAFSAHRDPSLRLDNALPRTDTTPAFTTPRTSTVGEQMAVYGSLGRQRSPSDATSPATHARWGAPLTVIGGKYLVTGNDLGLMVIDVAQARSRIAYVRLKQALIENKVRARPLLVPASQDVSEAQASLVEKGDIQLAALGIDIRRLGPGSVALRQIPLILEQADALHLVDAIVDYLSQPQRCSDGLLKKLAACVSKADVATDHASSMALLEALTSLNIVPPCGSLCARLGVDELAGLLSNALA